MNDLLLMLLLLAIILACGAGLLKQSLDEIGRQLTRVADILVASYGEGVYTPGDNSVDNLSRRDFLTRRWPSGEQRG